MHLDRLDPEHLDSRAVASAVALLEAARAEDRPYEKSVTVPSFTAGLRHGREGDVPATVALVSDDRGGAVGVLEVMLPHWDNTHLGIVRVAVDPRVRRQGIGRRIFQSGVDRIRSAGRRVVVAGCFDQAPGIRFLEAAGFEGVSAGLVCRQDLCDIDWISLDREYALAEPQAAGYELVKVPWPTPGSTRSRR